MDMDDAILRHCLRHVRFVTGTSYAGKSTLVARLARQYDLIACGENFHGSLAEAVVTPDRFPNLGYFQTMSGWPEFLSRSPQAYTAWLDGTSAEAAQFEVALLLQLPRDRLILADTNLPLETLGRIAGYHQIAVMLAPSGMATLRWGVDALRLTGLTATAEAGDVASRQTLAACGFCQAQDGAATAEGPVLYRYRVG